MKIAEIAYEKQKHSCAGCSKIVILYVPKGIKLAKVRCWHCLNNEDNYVHCRKESYDDKDRDNPSGR